MGRAGSTEQFLADSLEKILKARPVCTFHPELLPETLLLKICEAEASTPFPLMAEAIVLHFMYEIMREAGLRVPESLSHAVSIVGALVIGETAVNSGLIGGPTLLVIAMTAIA